MKGDVAVGARTELGKAANMGYEPITYCRHCNEPNDVYLSFEQRFCSEECETAFREENDKMDRAELGVDGNAGFALVGPDLQEGEAEFEEFSGDVRTSEGARQAKLAINRAFIRLKARLRRPISYYLGTSHPDHC